MKIATGLNALGKASAKAFLQRYEKAAQSEGYDLIASLKELEREVLSTDNFSYEVRRSHSTTGNPETIAFGDLELNFKESEG